MNKHILAGIIVGAIFAVVILWGAVSMALPEGGFVLLAVAADGLLSALCIGALIGANFALAAVEEKEKKERPQKLEAHAHAAA